MLWLQSPPWAKWIAVGLVCLLAVWLEFKPDPLVDHPFAATDIAPGDPIGPENTEIRRVPEGLLMPPAPESHAVEPIPTGAPVLQSNTASDDLLIPRGWWLVSIEVPDGAWVGDRVSIVLLDTGDVVPGYVASVSVDDAFSTTTGSVAVEQAHASSVASASAEGRASVLVSTG